MVDGKADDDGRHRDHKSLIAWQEADRLVTMLIHPIEVNWAPARGVVFHQLSRATLSIKLNIAEGYSFGRTRRFTNHLRIAHGSAVESKDLLELVLRQGWLPTPLLDDALSCCERVQRLISGLIRSLPH